MVDKMAKFSNWDYKSSYKSRPQIRISDRAYRVLAKGKGSMAEQIDILLGFMSVEDAIKNSRAYQIVGIDMLRECDSYKNEKVEIGEDNGSY